jgi:hypothetical protein
MPDMIVASTTATQEEIDHSVSANWRDPIPSKVPEQKTAPVVEEVKEITDPETPAADQVTDPAEIGSAPDADDTQEPTDRPKAKGGFQKKIDKLTREKGELAAQLAEFRERFEKIEQRLAPAAETKDDKPEVKTSADAPAKPLESEIGSKFKDWNEYNEALIEWKADRRLDAKLAERDQSAQQRETREIQEARESAYHESAKEFQTSHPDFNDAINAAIKAGMKLPQPILEKIQDLPNGPAVTYHLVTNPEDALALVQADPADGFMMLGRLSQGLELEAPPAKPAPAKKSISTAPHAVKPVAGHSAKSSRTLEDISKEGTDSWIRARQAQIEERDRRRYS